MNDIKSLLIATTVLAIGGLGLYMYKSEESELDIDDYNSETASESGSETGSELDYEIEDLDLELDYDDYKPKKSKNGTKKNAKKNNGTRKKY